MKLNEILEESEIFLSDDYFSIDEYLDDYYDLWLEENKKVDDKNNKVIYIVEKNTGGLTKWFKEKWVDISRKDKDGKHPPCGASAGSKRRGKSGKRAYPKCRPLHIANSMSSKEKKNASTRKRRKVKNSRGKKPVYVK